MDFLPVFFFNWNTISVGVRAVFPAHLKPFTHFKPKIDHFLQHETALSDYTEVQCEGNISESEGSKSLSSILTTSLVCFGLRLAVRSWWWTSLTKRWCMHVAYTSQTCTVCMLKTHISTFGVNLAQPRATLLIDEVFTLWHTHKGIHTDGCLAYKPPIKIITLNRRFSHHIVFSPVCPTPLMLQTLNPNWCSCIPLSKSAAAGGYVEIFSITSANVNRFIF